MVKALILPLPRPVHDVYNFEHDVMVGPCACGAWHHSPSDYLDRLPEWHIHQVNPPCDNLACSYCVARRFSMGQSRVESVFLALKKYRFNYQNEKDLQEGVGRALKSAGIPYEREKILGDPHGTIDFLVQGGLGIEIKIKGSPSAVARQLIRYCECDQVKELLLLTGRSALGRLPKVMQGKRLTVMSIWETFL